MPELPEVEIMASNVRRWTEGRTIARFDVDDPAVVVEGADLVRRLRGAPVLEVRRRAKHMIVRTELAEVAVHFRMTGKVVRGPAAGRVRWRVELDDGSCVDFVDARRLGELRLFTPGGAEAWLAGLGLGPDAWPARRDGGWWRERFAGAQGQLKPALLDQRRVAGLGNILACELAWRAGLDPFAPVSGLCDDDWSEIAVAVPDLIDDVLRTEAADEIAYVGETRGRDVPSVFSVYGRAGSPCRRCGRLVERTAQSGRSTYWCPVCQARGARHRG